MKIAMVTPYLPPRLGGREYWVPAMSKALTNLGIDVKIYCSNVDDFHKSKSKNEVGVFEGVPFFKAFTPFDLSKFSTPITFPPFKDLKKYNPDIIHIHEPNLILTTSLAIYGKYFLKKKIIMHNYSDPFDWLGGGFFFKLAMGFYKILHKLKLTISDAVIVISEEYRDYARFFRPFRHKIEILPMCLSEKFIQTKTYEIRNNIIYAGRLDKRKGIDTLIKSMDYLENMNLLIAGTGEKQTIKELHSLSKAIVKQNPSIRIEFLGNKTQTELNEILNDSAVLILPTSDKTAETFGAVLIEAWATGIPVISANNPAPSKLINDSGGGLIFERGDFKDLAENILFLLNNFEKAKQMGLNGQNYVSKKFSFEANAKIQLNIYKSIIK